MLILGAIERRGHTEPPGLIRDERRDQDQGDHDAEGDGGDEGLAANQRVEEEGDAGSGNDAVDEGDHAGGGRCERDETPAVNRCAGALFGPASAPLVENVRGFRRECPVIAADPGDDAEAVVTIDRDVDQARRW